MDRRCRGYVEALEEERQKILVFQRELPLCLQLVTQAIESWKEKEDSSSHGRPVLEQFIPLRPTSSSESEKSPIRDDDEEMRDKKPDWMRSVQLWNHEPDPLLKRDRPQKPVAVNARKLGGAFQPFEREKHVPMPNASAPATSSTVETIATVAIGGGAEMEGQSNSQRKARRCWSPELHRRFLHALQQLGGSHAATPKQIREMMKVDGLTNDEVKSHLQKYRLHTRRPTSAARSSRSRSSSPGAPQFVVVNGIWVPPPEYAAAVAAAATTATQPAGIYAHIASQEKKESKRSPNGPLHSDGRCSQDDSSLADNGSASFNSSSSQTVTALSPSTK